MKEKRIILPLAVLAILLVGCGEPGVSSSGGGGGGGYNPDDPTVKPDVIPAVFEKFEGELERNVEIKILENGNADKVGYSEELFDAFNEEYKEYGITAVDANIGEYNDLAQMGPYGTGPDVIYQANDIIMGYVDDKLVTPLPTYYMPDYEKIPATAWKAYESSATGERYTFGIPINVQTGLLYYRADLLPENWEAEWDDDGNNIPDMVENMNDLYRFSKLRHEANDDEYGLVFSLNDFYFSGSFLFTYGGYIFGNEDTDDTDIGLHKGDAAIGANIARTFAGVMSEECIDDSAKLAISGNMASGKYFASVTTPDNYEVIISALADQYEVDGKGTVEECDVLARENLLSVPFPDFPLSGNLEDASEGFASALTMGGINGFAISSYTKYPKASLAFINFAASYEMVCRRYETLGIAPCREDAAEIAGELSKQLFEKVDEGAIYLMPSLSSLSQVWSPAGSFFGDLAEDNLIRPVAERKYDTLEKIQAGLESTSQNIYDAIHILGV